MKKNNDGYVLPFVLVVMIVLTIISTSLMTAALRNLQSQQKFTERMVDKYAAEGEIEKIVAQLTTEENFFEVAKESDADTTMEAVLKTRIENLCGSIFGEWVSWTSPSTTERLTCNFKLKSEVQSALVISEIEWSGKVAVNEPPADQLPKDTTYTITDLKLTYQSYEISTKEVAE